MAVHPRESTMISRSMPTGWRKTLSPKGERGNLEGSNARMDWTVGHTTPVLDRGPWLGHTVRCSTDASARVTARRRRPDCNINDVLLGQHNINDTSLRRTEMRQPDQTSRMTSFLVSSVGQPVADQLSVSERRHRQRPRIELGLLDPFDSILCSDEVPSVP